MQLISFYSGMGGFELAAEWMGWEVITSVEINPFCQSILKYYWPKAYHHSDVKTVNYEEIKKKISGQTVFTAGFPCQPFSTAGERKGTNDDRYGWPHCIAAVRALRPSWCVFENVRGLTNWNGGMVFDQVQADLEAEGYETIPFLLPACSVGAPHRRDRIWIIAYSKRGIHSSGYGSTGAAAHTNGDVHAGGLDARGNSRKTTGGKGKDKQQDNGTKNGKRVRPQPSTSSADASNAAGSRGGKVHEQVQREISNGEVSNSDGKERDAANATGQGREERKSSRGRKGAAKDGTGLESRVKRLSQDGDAANADGERLQRWLQPGEQISKGAHGASERREPTRTSATPDWEKFPTQSPLCNGDDGIPPLLDASAVFNRPCKPSGARTFSKWRKESVKAGGNAIVPQVALQIFKAIELYNQYNQQS